MALLSFIAICLLPLVFGLTVGNVSEIRVPAIYAFGDSLFDVGNNNYLELAKQDTANFPHNGIDFPNRIPTGRFSNGYIGIDFIAKIFGFKMSPPPYLSIRHANQVLKGVNFASGGSGILDTTGNGTITFSTQIRYFEKVTRMLSQHMEQKSAETSLSQSLFVISTVSNDLFAFFALTGATNATLNHNFISSLVDDFVNHLKSLYKLGARKFWISGVGQIGCIPYLMSRNPSGGCFDDLNHLAQSYGEAAKRRLRHLSLRLVGMKYSYSDSYAMTAAIKANPHALGLTEIIGACCGDGKYNGEFQCLPKVTYCSNRDNYFFWDWFHPTEAVYKLTAILAYNGTFSTPINIKQLVLITGASTSLSDK
ncbi:GDSL esterase/lipase At5g55050-like [Typha angustifolia]|uniref:GDSL esterase/lipase At5g55050-like n=1 Tax=Typha angustifolia TaxID=59011 RepID=UPI003C2CBBA5